ncbi:MAG TPA: AraC family transcriptional regulator [Niabella sp.]|nr:AraC family transcriptional regulator [Niabella sp.]
MKPHFHRVPVPVQNSFSVRHDQINAFGKLLHYHPELELHYIIRGEGIRIIGDNVSHINAGEVILLGENLPHAWREKEIEEPLPDKAFQIEAIVIQFTPSCLGKGFFHLPEAYLIPRLFELAKKGLLINGSTAERVKALMRSIIHCSKFEKIITLLKILQVISESEEINSIAKAYAYYKADESETDRLNTIIAYTLSNYNKEIKLEEVAVLCNFSVTSFCRYFKGLTQKTYFDFLTEVRISNACRMIIDDKFSLSYICSECGFNNVSNFYRHFKRIMLMTPLEYKREYKKQYAA